MQPRHMLFKGIDRIEFPHRMNNKARYSANVRLFKCISIVQKKRQGCLLLPLCPYYRDAQCFCDIVHLLTTNLTFFQHYNITKVKCQLFS